MLQSCIHVLCIFMNIYALPLHSLHAYEGSSFIPCLSARNCIQDVGFSVEFLDASRTKRPMLPYQRYESHQVLQPSFIQICKVSSLVEISRHMDREGTSSI